MWYPHTDTTFFLKNLPTFVLSFKTKKLDAQPLHMPHNFSTDSIGIN